VRLTARSKGGLVGDGDELRRPVPALNLVEKI